MTLDSDGATANPLTGARATARLVVVDAHGRSVETHRMAGAGLAQVTRTGDGVITGGRDGFTTWTPGSRARLTTRISTNWPHTQLFSVNGHTVSFYNVGYSDDGKYAFQIVTAHPDGTVQSFALPQTVESVGQCGDKLVIVATDEALDHYQLPHEAYTFDPATQKLQSIARWRPTQPIDDNYTSYSACGPQGMMTLQSAVTEREKADGIMLEIVTTRGARRALKLIDDRGRPYPEVHPNGGRTTLLIGDDLYWIGYIDELKENAVYRTHVRTGRTAKLYDLQAKGMYNREKITAVDGKALMEFDQPVKGSEYILTVRRITDGTILLGPLPIHGQKVNQPRFPIMAVALSTRLRDGLPLAADGPTPAASP